MSSCFFPLLDIVGEEEIEASEKEQTPKKGTSNENETE